RWFGAEMAPRVAGRGPDRRHVHLGGFRLATLEFVADRLEEQLLVVAGDADRRPQRNGIAHHDVFARLPALPDLLEGLFQHLEERDGIEIDVVPTELSGVELEV